MDFFGPLGQTEVFKNLPKWFAIATNLGTNTKIKSLGLELQILPFT